VRIMGNKSKRMLILLLGLVLIPIAQVQAADVRVIDVAQVTWTGADAPAGTMNDVVYAIQNQVGPNWASFTTLQGDTRDRTISFTYGQTLTTPVRLTTRMACDRADFTSFMNTIRNEVYRQPFE